MKRLLLFIASLTLMIGVLAACGTTENATGGADGPVTIKLHTHGTESGYAWEKRLKHLRKNMKILRLKSFN
ncbi:hypothetical protein ACI2OX_01745 [Bacillus sp. N9]